MTLPTFAGPALAYAPGVYPRLAFPEYHAIEAWGSSSLRAMRVGPPALVKWRREHPDEDTPDTLRGTRAHSLILTPPLFDRSYVETPPDAPERPTAAMLAAKSPSESSLARQSWWRAFEATRAGRECLSAKCMGELRDVAAAFRAKSIAADSLDRAAAVEESHVWTDDATGELCKSRIDWRDDEAVYDLKVSRHAEGRSVAYRAFVEGWMHQLAHYVYGRLALGFPRLKARLVVIGPKPPQSLRVYCLEVKDAAIDVLALDNERTLRQLRECREADCWPSTPNEWTKVEPPSNALMEVVSAVDFSAAEEV